MIIMIIEEGLTIKDALDMDCLRNCSLAAGYRGRDNKISRVNVMSDYDVVDFVTAGELLLTTEMSLNTNPDQRISLIEALNMRKLSGLAIKPRDTKLGLDQGLLDAAEGMNFPIIELNPDIPFSEIINAILEKILDKQTSLLMKLEKIHENLMNIVLEGGSLQEIASTLNNTTQNPISIEDNVFGNLFVAGADPMVKEELLSIVSRVSREDNILKEKGYYKDVMGGKTYNRVTIPILAGQNIYGYIHLWEIYKNIEALDIRALETASTVVALEIVKRLSVYQVESRYKIEFLENLLSKDIALHRLALERSSCFDWDSQEGCVVMIINILRDAKVLKQENPKSSPLKLHKSSIVGEIERTAQILRKKVIVGEKSESIVVLMNGSRDIKEQNIKESAIDFAVKIIKNLSQKHRDIKFRIGMGRYYYDDKEFWKSYQDALRAVNLGGLDNDDEIVHYDDLGVYRLLNQDAMDKELERFYSETVLPLVEYDNTKGTELVKTLMAYFKANGNLKKMSEFLYTHYNTVLYRLQRIKEITNIDLEDPRQRLNAEIGLKIANILKNNIKVTL